MDGLIVTPMTADHLDAVTEMERVCFSTPWSRKSFEDGLANTFTQSYFTALLGGEVVGYMCLFHLFEEGELLNIAVSPEKRGLGIGKAMMDTMFSYLKNKNVSRITLEVRESNTAAKSLYTRSGFAPIAIRKNYYTAPLENGIVMETHV